jgi:hypothetical protein
VVSSDLGTPGSTVPSCANSDVGDDGLLNPIRNGQALRTHEPWTTLAPGERPARCGMDPNQYPSFLTFTADATDAVAFAEDFVCNAFLSTGGCGLEQQLESVYRALVVHDPRDRPGNMDPNAGFVRDNAVLALVIISDEEDMSVRDCRYAERGRPCTDALSVFDSTSGQWSSSDLNLRAYQYRPGSDQDPTWPLDRYIDPTNPARGFLSLKPGHPDLVVFAAITGVPINPPLRAGSQDEIDWDQLLGRNADGSDGYTAMSAEGPISMRQANTDPACVMVNNRVVPACRLEGSPYDPTHPPCDGNTQYFAWPSRRLATVARRFADTYRNGMVSSICRRDYAGALRQIVEKIQQNLTGRCLPRVLPTTPPLCDASGQPAGCASAANGHLITVPCIVRETLPAGMTACDAAHGRHASGRDVDGRTQCLVDQVPVVPGGAPAAGGHGFYYDTSVDPLGPTCGQRISFTTGDSLPTGASAVIECVQTVGDGAE